MLVVAVAAVAWWQWENIKVIYTVLTADDETIAQNMEQTRQSHLQSLQEEYGITVFAPSLEQSEELLNGTKTAEEVKRELGLESEGEEAAQDGGNASNASASGGQSGGQGSGSTGQQSSQDLVNRCVSELYAYKADLMGQLGGIKASVLAQWEAGEKTEARKQSLAMSALNQAYGLEGAADGTVQSILSRYRSQLAAIGADTSVIDTLWGYYVNEKEAEKAYYLNQYM